MAKSKADQLKEKVTIPKMDAQRETEATRSRMSKSRYKSGEIRGPRTYKMTVPIPPSLNDDVRAICGILDIKETDLINECLENFVKDHKDVLEAVQRVRDEYAAKKE